MDAATTPGTVPEASPADSRATSGATSGATSRATSPQDAPPPRRPRGRPRDPRTDTRIIEAAAALLRSRGFERMTVDDVAAEAGVGKATVYRRWPSKDDLAVAAMQQFYSVEFPEPDTGSIWTDLELAFRGVFGFAQSAEGAAYVRMSIAESVRDERIAALYRTATERAEERARRMYHRAIERGEVRPDTDIDCCVQWVTGLLAVRAITNRPMPSVEDVPRLVDQVLRGILVDPSRRPT